ncbi:MAG: family 1 glycosylhydrolase [Caulobacteraceae bacterium]
MLELWGGHECTVNRVGEVWRDQTIRSGHQDRLSDLALFANLNIKALRYPILWERVAPDDPNVRDWSWTDERLAEIRRLGMRPIAGLLHHGSGPHYTSLVSDNFVQGLADHARATAERYPWILDWTPVNEPLTTARFSGLYGHWYPHAEDERTFWLALLNEIDGTRAAMADIRKVIPGARLIQTEDLGQAYGTEPFADEVAFQNTRRWISWDLLTGKVTPDHPLWARLEAFGFAARLADIAAAPCPPDVLGVNFYITSERFLDHRAERYPQWVAGDLGQFDMDALRVLEPRPVGLEGLLQQAWDRYGLPIAVTESHLNGTRDEQMRWTAEAWTTALRLQAKGVDFRAITAWALLGSFDWNSLLTKEAGFYEAGTFDIRSGTPRPTGMAGMLRRLGSGENAAWLEADPVLGDPGWWRREIRLSLPIHRWGEGPREPPLPPTPKLAPVLIIGAAGTLGQAFAQACTIRGLRYVLTRRAECDLLDPDSITAALAAHKPWAVVNAAGWLDVDAAEQEPDACFAANTVGPANLARACAAAGLHLTSFSSALVFDGLTERLYVETDAPAPLSVYGQSLAQAEQAVADLLPSALIIRTGPLFSPDDASDFANRLVARLGAGLPALASENIVTPTYTPDLVDACLNLIIDKASGLVHLSQETPLSWLAFGQAIARSVQLDPALVQAATPDQLGWRAIRPDNAALRSIYGAVLSSLDDALARFAAVVLEARARAPRRRDFGAGQPREAERALEDGGR